MCQFSYQTRNPVACRLSLAVIAGVVESAGRQVATRVGNCILKRLVAGKRVVMLLGQSWKRRMAPTQNLGLTWVLSVD